MTARTDEEVQSTTISGLLCLMAARASGLTFTRSGRGSSAISATSRPTLARIDVDGADDAKAVARGELASDHDADRTEPVEQHPDHV